MYNAMKPSTRKFNVNKDIISDRAKVVLTVAKTNNLTRLALIGPIIFARIGRYIGVCIGLRYPVSTYIIHIRAMKLCSDWVSGQSGVDLPDLYFCSHPPITGSPQSKVPPPPSSPPILRKGDLYFRHCASDECSPQWWG